MHLSRLLAGGAVAALVTGTAACGAQALEPKIALRDAASAFSASGTGAMELSIASSVDEVLAFAAAADPASGADPGISDGDLETLLSSSLEMAWDLGEDQESETDDRSRVIVHIGDLLAGEVRSVGSMLYARADADGLAEKFPDMQEGLDSFRAGLAGEDGMEPAPAEIQGPATAFLDGEWISFDLEAYLAEMEKMASTEAREVLGAALKDAVISVERRESDEIGDHLVAKLDLRKVYTKLRAELPGLYEGEEAELIEESLPPVSEVPDKQIDVSFWLRDGELKRAELDLAQFLDEPAGSLVLRADALQEREIDAPDGAVELDLTALLEAGMSGAPLADEAPLEAEELDAYTVAMWLDTDIFYVAEEGGSAPSVRYLADVLPGYEGMVPGLAITVVGERIQVAVDQDVVCLTLSADGMGENILEGPC